MKTKKLGEPLVNIIRKGSRLHTNMTAIFQLLELGSIAYHRTDFEQAITDNDSAEVLATSSKLSTMSGCLKEHSAEFMSTGEDYESMDQWKADVDIAKAVMQEYNGLIVNAEKEIERRLEILRGHVGSKSVAAAGGGGIANSPFVVTQAPNPLAASGSNGKQPSDITHVLLQSLLPPHLQAHCRMPRNNEAGGGSSKFSGGAAAEAAAAAGPSNEVTPHVNAQARHKRSAGDAEFEQSNADQKRVALGDGQAPVAKSVQQQNINKGKGRARDQQGEDLLQFVDHRQVDASGGASPNPHGNKESDAVAAATQNRATPPSITADDEVEVDGLFFTESGTAIADYKVAKRSPSPESTVVVSDKIAPLHTKGKGRF